MGNTSKGFSLLFIVILAISSLLMIKPTDAHLIPAPDFEAIPQPSVPKFTLKFEDHSYFSALNESVDKRTIMVEINNQNFTAYKANGTVVQLFYNIQWKNHSASSWHTYGPNNTWLIPVHYYLNSNNTNQSSYPIPQTSTLNYILGKYNDGLIIDNFTANQQIDFQVKAFIGYTEPAEQPTAYISNGQTRYVLLHVFVGKESVWSNTQTFTIPDTFPATSPTPNPTPTPAIPEFASWTIPLLFTLMLVAAGLLVYHKKHKHNLVKKP
jgi:hypothetical protein